ncbi:glycosyl hydrolase family 57 [Lamprobacter modestohalophilus]|uniref:Glycosyl hydrolase family 57 n=1 Tax=Lamprobacter modestohalophilus TaxID=1064514 RepID=A0A9X0W6C3_9GAMM|nr:glycosyl hydrolase family 57 [Lamprobacter modestohalophilus]MBK1617606.1 glycosyl hydrolase family 57 [Lamprobacter modestohalophilus]
MPVFNRFLNIECPSRLEIAADGSYPAFRVAFSADGEIPFPQVIVRASGRETLINGEAIVGSEEASGRWHYQVSMPAGRAASERLDLQIEGCRRAEIQQAGGGDWIKTFAGVRLERAGDEAGSARHGQTGSAEPAGTGEGAAQAGAEQRSPSAQIQLAQSNGAEVKVYFGIHKHMHQPYYDTTNPDYWDGEKDEIFGSRGGNYTDFVPAAIRQYRDGGLDHGGLSTSWSGTLIEQLERCDELGRCGGRFSGWNRALSEMASAKTALGNPRLAFSAFGFYHPLMPLIPHRDIVRNIRWHRELIQRVFGAEASRVLFPPETAFHVRMIPALVEAGVEAVIYDSIHRFRACKDYPYAGIEEGMLPPNPADQTNPPVDDWLQLHNIWAASKISPSLLRPEYVGYEDADGELHKIIAIPAERYIGNEDARGGFGALQYPDVLGQLYQRIVDTGSFDPKHPPFFLLHSDGDNHGGGADSYYHHNTGQLVDWLKRDPRFELTTAEDYLQRFPPDPSQVAHIEPGSWAGADNGDPQFMKWFSRYDQPYSPDLNSWAVLTAFQDRVHTLEDSEPDHPALAEAIRLLLTAETSCYWYWTGQTGWDQQVTNAANLGLSRIGQAIDDLVASGQDRRGPTIFPPWVTPENPGGKRWGQGCLLDAPRESVLHSFVSDCAGLKSVELVLRSDTGEQRLPMHDHGPYPSQTGAALSAHYLTAQLPLGAGDVRYYIEAEDQRGNIARGSLERIFLA